MEIHKRFFPSIMLDNETTYFSHLEGILSAVDEFSSLEVTKNPLTYHFRLVSSHPKYNQMLLEEILKFHNMFGIKLDISKSIKTTGTIVFDIVL